MENEKEIKIIMSIAPTNPDEKKAWAKQMLRIQVAMWVDDKATCAFCGHIYESVDDFLERDPRNGYKTPEWDDMFVCNNCWAEYESLRTLSG